MNHAYLDVFEKLKKKILQFFRKIGIDIFAGVKILTENSPRVNIKASNFDIFTILWFRSKYESEDFVLNFIFALVLRQIFLFRVNVEVENRIIIFHWGFTSV